MADQVDGLQNDHAQRRNQMQMDKLRSRGSGCQQAGGTTGHIPGKKNKVQERIGSGFLGEMTKSGKGHFDPASMNE